MTLRVLESYDLGVIVRATEDEALLLIGTAARDCLRASHTSIVAASPESPLALLGLPRTSAPPRDLITDTLFPVMGRDWYLVGEAATREAYGNADPVISRTAPDPTIWPSDTMAARVDAERPVLVGAYFDDDEPALTDMAEER